MKTESETSTKSEKETIVNLSEGTGKKEHKQDEFEMLVREQNTTK